MLGKLAAATVVLLFSNVAQAAWFMIGPQEFRPEDATTKVSLLADGLKSDKAGYVRAPIHLPTGVTMLSVFCQLYDASTANNINVNVVETSTDDGAGVTQRVIFAFNSSGSSGHVKYFSDTPRISANIRDFDGSGVGGNRYYSYAIRAYLDGTPSTAVKSCAISY